MKINKGNSGGRARVRVFLAEIEGDDDTIQEALRSVGAALGKTFQQPTSIVRALPPSSVGSSKDADSSPSSDAREGEVVDEVEDARETAPSPKSPPRSQSHSRKAPVYSFVKDINFRPADKPSLKDFFEQKKPANQQQKLTVIIYYLCRILEIDSVGVDHVYSGLDEVGIKTPSDISQICRNIASRKNWIDSSDSEHLVTTIKGDNFVKYDLPHTKSAKES